MKKLIYILLPIILLTACSPGDTKESNVYSLYYFANDDKSAFSEVSATIPHPLSEDEIHEIFEKLKSPDDKRLSPAIREELKLKDVSIINNKCTLTLSEGYNNIPVIERTAVNAALTKTLCSLNCISSVIINCTEVSLEFSESDFVLSAPRTYYETHLINIYYLNEDSNGLRSESTHISLAPGTTIEQATLERLLESHDTTSFKTAIPKGTHLNGIYVNQGICYVDLSSEFVTNALHDELHEELAIYSIVNTLTELPMINSVKIIVDGQAPSGYLHFNLTNSLTNKKVLSN